MGQKVNFSNSNSANITISAVINFPEGFNEKKKYPIIVVSHPGGGVKEQAAGLYAKKLAEKGFVTIAYDASYQGESTGEPRQLENPYIRTEDVSAVIDYITTLPYADTDNIGAMGICAGGGYTANAAINDHRIKAVGTVSAVNIGSMFRNGWENNVKDADALPFLIAGSNARTNDASGAAIATIPLAPMKEEDAPNEELREAWEYYHTDRCQYPTAPGYATARSLTQIISYDAYNKAEAFFTQPLQTIVGSNAGSKWMSDDLMKRAATKDKKMHIIEGANHMSLYDKLNYVDEAVSVLTLFFKKNIASDSLSATRKESVTA
ncbi:MAG: alpha/beta hydrolase [Chitinophagaceae bacterium]|nr:alpha/beta hydrolase [Chitinophagaceae bacterium]